MNRTVYKILASGLALGFGVAALPASATIIIYNTPGAVQPDENVLLNTAPPTGNLAFGRTNQTNTDVTFRGIEPLATPSNGQARVEAADGGLSALEFFLTDDSLGFTEVEFNIFGTRRTAQNATLNFTDQFGEVFSQMFSLNNGQNFFSAEAIDGQLITNVSFTLDGNVTDVRQFRIGGVESIGGVGVVPEPGVWALMIAGFGLVGAANRRRNRTPVVAA